MRTLAIYNSTIEADLVRVHLEGATGIQAIVLDSHLAQLNPLWAIALGGVRVVVAECDWDRAKQALPSLGRRLPEEGADATLRRKRVTWAWLLVGLVSW